METTCRSKTSRSEQISKSASTTGGCGICTRSSMSRICPRFVMAFLEGIFVGPSIGETARNLKKKPRLLIDHVVNELPAVSLQYSLTIDAVTLRRRRREHRCFTSRTRHIQGESRRHRPGGSAHPGGREDPRLPSPSVGDLGGNRGVAGRHLKSPHPPFVKGGQGGIFTPGS